MIDDAVKRFSRSVGLAWGLAALMLSVLPPSAPAQGMERLELLRLSEAEDYRGWMERFAWEDLRPISRRTRFSDSARRFKLEGGALRMATRKNSYYIGSRLEGLLPVSLLEYPYLRFVVRIDRAPRGAELTGERHDDSALRIFAVTRPRPIQTVVYAWSWTLPVGRWSARGLSERGLFNNVRRKSFGQGEPLKGQWLTVEVNLLEDFRSQFPMYTDPALKALHLKADSNDTPRARSLAWVRSVSLHRHSLRERGLAEGAPYEDTLLWYR
ncbi:MAG: DUF3047 domain-containing protein [SAR324 cluster bacterium]|nr:DUF3047 domain-containing protein [SAR324 cluster bacterium]